MWYLFLHLPGRSPVVCASQEVPAQGRCRKVNAYFRWTKVLPFPAAPFRFYLYLRALFLTFIWYPEIVKICFESVLSGKAGITQITTFLFPLMQTTIIEHLQLFINDKGNNAVLENTKKRIILL